MPQWVRLSEWLGACVVTRRIDLAFKLTDVFLKKRVMCFAKPQLRRIYKIHFVI